MQDKKRLADKAISIAASYDGFNRINFNANGYEVLPIIYYLAGTKKRC